MHFHFMTLMAKIPAPLPLPPTISVDYSLAIILICLSELILICLSGLCLGLEGGGEFKKKNAFSLYDLYGHALTQVPLARGS